MLNEINLFHCHRDLSEFIEDPHIEGNITQTRAYRRMRQSHPVRGDEADIEDNADIEERRVWVIFDVYHPLLPPDKDICTHGTSTRRCYAV